MNAITQSLLASAALVALATAPTLAGSPPPFRITALHAGHVVNKTRIRPHQGHQTSYTFGAYTYVPASDLGIRVKLPATYYKWNSAPNGYFTLCSKPKQWIRLTTKKTIYARIGKSTETYSYGCPSGSTVFYGDTYRLQKASGEVQYDSFISELLGKFRGPGGEMYKGDLVLHVYVTIGAE